MNIIRYFRKLLGRGPKKTRAYQIDCPNCWGEQQYDGEVREVLSREHIDLNNVDRKLGWIEGYVIKHFEGIGVKIRKGRKVSPVPRKEW